MWLPPAESMSNGETRSKTNMDVTREQRSKDWWWHALMVSVGRRNAGEDVIAIDFKYVIADSAVKCLTGSNVRRNCSHFQLKV